MADEKVALLGPYFVSKAISSLVKSLRGKIMDGGRSIQQSRSPCSTWVLKVRCEFFSYKPNGWTGISFLCEMIQGWKGDQSVCRKRGSAIRKTGFFLMFLWCLHYLRSWFSPWVVLLFFFSPTLLFLYCAAKPCSRWGTELTATEIEVTEVYREIDQPQCLEIFQLRPFQNESRTSIEKEKKSLLLKHVLMVNNSLHRYVEQYFFCEPLTNLGTVTQFRGFLEEMDSRQNWWSWWEIF